MTESEQMKQQMMSEVERIRAERLATQKRTELLHVAAMIAGGARGVSAKDIVDAAVTLVDEVNRRASCDGTPRG